MDLYDLMDALFPRPVVAVDKDGAHEWTYRAREVNPGITRMTIMPDGSMDIECATVAFREMVIESLRAFGAEVVTDPQPDD